MKQEILTSIEELRKQFDPSSVMVREDGSGGAYVIVERVPLGDKYQPSDSWVGFHLTAQYPYADIYPVFIDGAVRRSDGKALSAPVTTGHVFEQRSAIQISRRSTAANALQKANAKILKILSFLENSP